MAMRLTRPTVIVRFHTRGDYLIGVAVVCSAGAPTVFTVRANLRELEKLYAGILQARARTAGVGFLGFIKKAFKSVKKAVRSVAKSKVLRSIYKGVRKVMKSPITNIALTAASVAFPPIGIPAQAAFVASNKMLDAVEAGGRAASRAKGQIRKLSRIARTRTRAGKKARKITRVLTMTNSWRKGLAVASARAGGRGRARHRDPAKIRGYIMLPNGRRAPVRGVERRGRIDAIVTLPNGRRARLRASVSGACACD